MTTRELIITACFCFVMACNVVALVRHWQMMRVLQIVLNGLIETQNEYTEVMRAEHERRQTSLAPD